uniref:Apolipoprotein C-IV n=1 Tax=Electrophorus electricus TaxID=8005 RepID=A0A4W4ELJ9_ELEEL
ISRLVVFALVIVLQATLFVCVWVCVFASELKERIVSTGSVVADLASMYYEDHVKTITDPYIQWAKDKTSSLWNRVKDRVSSYTST